jgi:hypothetical protein
MVIPIHSWVSHLLYLGTHFGWALTSRTEPGLTEPGMTAALTSGTRREHPTAPGGLAWPGGAILARALSAGSPAAAYQAVFRWTVPFTALAPSSRW